MAVNDQRYNCVAQPMRHLRLVIGACHQSFMNGVRASIVGLAVMRRLGGKELGLGPLPRLVALGYALLGVCASANDNYEVFPFFPWFLFPLTPDRVVRYELTPAPELNELGRLHQMDLHVLTQRLGAALERDDRNSIVELRRRLEYNFVTLPCGYSVVRTEYEPTARWTHGTMTSRPLAEFTCRQEL